MRQTHIIAVLVGILCLSLGILVGNLVVLYYNIYWIPEQAVVDLCDTLSEEGIRLDSALVPRKKENSMLYVSDGADYDEKAALLLADSEIRSTYAIPGGQLFVHYNGDITEFTGSFSFHYRRAGLGTEGRLDADIDGTVSAYDAWTAGLAELSVVGEAAQVAMAFLDRQDGALGTAVEIETVIAAVYGTEDGQAYVRCLRQIDGVEITENAVTCLVEDGVVVEAVGKWCFMTLGDSYMAQLSDITNILFMMKRVITGQGDTPYCTIIGLRRCYSLYLFGQDDGFCLIPCWRIETDTMGTFVFSALDGTLYSRHVLQ